ncbi:UDP-N-acetylglucosamine--N-acetylmuramyl-(pentapeptide) pyrophosphoryl-undecaprenol N-acetylglucosamine transferase [Dethiosulfovibrio salsuginis]|nr:UDP-N-acetylglucosamine--N-acetylmuramyl-(pentapeptide) pyrophosphoryl-undecaprenol N-acetylglucosamine transferase [Dethiosulfovibrio salsuginis]
MRLLMVAGGTGGHITPAIALGEWRKGQGDKVHYLCGNRPLELELYSYHGIDPHALALEGSPLGTKDPLVALKRCWAIARSFFDVARLFKMEAPEVVILFGGYICLPALIVGFVMGKKIVLHEQNAVAGKITRLAHILGVPIATGWRRCKAVDGTYTGTPVRRIRPITRDKALQELGIDYKSLEDRKIISVIGGSLGGLSVVKAILRRPFMVESSGYIYLYPTRDVALCPPGMLAVRQSWDMSAIYAASDLVICRGGGATLAELSCYGLPAIVVPWMNSADGHQKANAISFVAESSSKVGVWLESEGYQRLFFLINKLSSLSRSSSSADCESASRLWRLILSHI